jgi:multiple sugar transport system permease protein
MGALTIIPAILLFMFLNLAPIAWAIAGGFFSIPALSPEWTWVGLDNYVFILRDDAFWTAAWVGLIFTGGSIIVQLGVGIGLALLVNRDFKYKYFVRTVIMFPYLVPTAVVGFIALWMNNDSFGITNQFLQQIGLIDQYIAFYGTPDYALPAVIATFSWKFTIFVTIMVLAKLQSIPDSFYEAAEVSGASAFDKFRDITFPQIKDVIFIVLLLRGVWTLNKFDIIWVLTQGGPGDATFTPPVYVFETAFITNRIGRAAAISVLLFIVLGTVAILYFKYLNPEEEVAVE